MTQNQKHPAGIHEDVIEFDKMLDCYTCIKNPKPCYDILFSDLITAESCLTRHVNSSGGSIFTKVLYSFVSMYT